MRKIVVWLGLLLWAVSANAQQLPPPILTNAIPGWVTQSNGQFATVDLDCANQRFWPWDALGRIAVARASVEYDPGADGTLYAFAANQLPITSLGCWIWESHINSLPQSQFASGWTATATTATINNATAPDRTTTAALLVPTNSATDHAYAATTGLTLTSAVYNYSVYARPSGYNFASVVAITGAAGVTRFSCVVNLLTGAVTQTESAGTPTATGCQAQVWPNGWTRISVQTTDTTAATSSDIALSAASTGTPTFNAVTLNPTFAGDGTSGALFWGAEIVLGTFPHSYCPTTTVAATCAATVATMPLPAGATSTSGYALLGIGTPVAPPGYAQNQAVATISDGTSNNRLEIYRASSTGDAQAQETISGVNVAINTSSVWNANSQGKLIVFAIPSSFRALFNSTGAGPGATSGLASGSQLQIGLNGAAGGQWNGPIVRLTAGPFSLLNQ